jgi:putative FmdB family regulatory protein
MPIYDFKCTACGHRAEVMRKIADPSVTACPACGAQDAFSKMLSAAGFQLKGSGWYATDFKGGASAPAKAEAPPAAAETGGHACGTGGCGSCG